MQDGINSKSCKSKKHDFQTALLPILHLHTQFQCIIYNFSVKLCVGLAQRLIIAFQLFVPHLPLLMANKNSPPRWVTRMHCNQPI